MPCPAVRGWWLQKVTVLVTNLGGDHPVVFVLCQNMSLLASVCVVTSQFHTSSNPTNKQVKPVS
jgi:hypothetical protein